MMPSARRRDERQAWFEEKGERRTRPPRSGLVQPLIILTGNAIYRRRTFSLRRVLNDVNPSEIA
jgi:hypothetical protein